MYIRVCTCIYFFFLCTACGKGQPDGSDAGGELDVSFRFSSSHRLHRYSAKRTEQVVAVRESVSWLRAY